MLKGNLTKTPAVGSYTPQLMSKHTPQPQIKEPLNSELALIRVKMRNLSHSGVCLRAVKSMNYATNHPKSQSDYLAARNLRALIR